MVTNRTLDAERILGLDLSKKTFKGCRLEAKEGFQERHAFHGNLDAEGKKKLASKIEPGDYVVFEGGPSSSDLARYLMENSKAKEILVLNPANLNKYIKGCTKTDKKDAVSIAEYIRDCNPVAWKLLYVPTRLEQSERAMIKHNIQLKKDHVRNINRLHGLFSLFGMPMLKKTDLNIPDKRNQYIATYLSFDNHMLETAIQMHEMLLTLEKQLEDSLEAIRNYILKAHPRESLLWMSIPGVGLLTTATLIAYLGDCSRFEDPDQLRNYVGLIPFLSQSGTSVNFIGNVNSHGCMPVRRNITQCAWTLKNIRTPNEFTEFWNVRKAEGKNSKKTAIAVANRILTKGWILLKKNELLRMPDYGYLKTKLRAYKLNAPEMNTLLDQFITEGTR